MKSTEEILYDYSKDECGFKDWAEFSKTLSSEMESLNFGWGL